MSNTKSTIKNIISLCLLPVISLFAFSFYVFWTYPVRILTKELELTGYFLFNNPYLQTSLLVCIILFIALIITSKFYSKVFPYILGLILVFLIGTFLYKITSYDFGTFVDNNSLSTSKLVLGYSFWYFALDIVFPILSIIITVFALKKNFYKAIFLLFLVFYTTENIITLTQLKITDFSFDLPITKEQGAREITISSNHPNLFLFMFDSINTPVMLDIINNQWNDKQKAWTKDFTFYDNVTSLTTENTTGSFANLIGGYSFTHQEQIAFYLSNSLDIFKKTNKFSTADPTWYHRERALLHIEEELNQQIDITSMRIQDRTFSTNIKADLTPSKTPIINVSLYFYTPYILRNNLANNRVVSASFGWNNYFSNTEWITINKSILVHIRETDKPKFYLIYNEGLHYPYTNPTSPIDIYYAKTSEDINTIITHTANYNMKDLNFLVDILKKNEVYDSTRIIINTDHGTLRQGGTERIIQEYIETIAPPQSLPIYKMTLHHYSNEYSLGFQLPVFIMDKKINTTQDKMKVDSRFLSLADTYGAVINTFTNSYPIPDYLVISPPKRAFNIPSLTWGVSQHLMGIRSDYWIPYFVDFTNQIAMNSNYFVKMYDIKTGQFEVFKHGTNIADITNIPSVEYLE